MLLVPDKERITVIETPTVFVLGAGASVPFGFPTGFALSERVVVTTHEHSNGYKDLVRLGADEGQLNTFRYAFMRSAFNSVDAFLERRTELIDIGKLVMGFILARHESNEELFKFPGNWLRSLYDRIATVDFSDLRRNHVSFITFNYDRNVEHFLFDAIKNSYNKEPSAVRPVMQEHFPIIHLHGRLGYLPWEGQVPENTHAYQGTLTRQSLRTCADNIKVIHEDTRGRDEDFRRAKHLVDSAEKIVFLGFGFNERNVSRLGVSDLPPGKALAMVHTTKRVALHRAQEATNNKIAFMPNDCDFFFEDRFHWR